jgi:hypothetical protein
MQKDRRIGSPIPFVKIGHSVKYSLSDLENYIEKQSYTHTPNIARGMMENSVLLAPESEKAIKFLKRKKPKGPWALTSIAIDEKGIDTDTFCSSDEDKLPEWLEKYNGKRNIYFHANTPMRSFKKTAKKEDIRSVDCLHVDIDPDGVHQTLQFCYSLLKEAFQHTKKYCCTCF